MALEVTSLKREFKFTKNGTVITLADPDPALTVQEVMNYYSNQYPELTTASVDGPKVDGKSTVYTAKTSVGTKG